MRRLSSWVVLVSLTASACAARTEVPEGSGANASAYSESARPEEAIDVGGFTAADNVASNAGRMRVAFGADAPAETMFANADASAGTAQGFRWNAEPTGVPPYVVYGNSGSCQQVDVSFGSLTENKPKVGVFRCDELDAQVYVLGCEGPAPARHVPIQRATSCRVIVDAVDDVIPETSFMKYKVRARFAATLAAGDGFPAREVRGAIAGYFTDVLSLAR